MSTKFIFYINTWLLRNKKKVLLRNVFFLLFILIAIQIKAQSATDALTSALNKSYKQNDFPGFAVAIVNSDRILYENGFGFADLEKKIQYTPYTLQPIASISKLFIGMAVMKAIEQGLMSMDMEINSILPFNLKNPYTPKIPITLKHLVTHTSGIIDNPDTYKKTYFYNSPIQEDNLLYKQIKSKGYGFEGKDTTLADFLTEYLRPSGSYYSKKNFNKNAPGNRYEYSNIGSDLAAWLIELKSGMSFDQYTQKHILQPLMMKNATWSTAKANQDKLSVLYTGDYSPYPKYSSITYPDGGLTTSCHELSLFLKEIIAGHQGVGQILSPASYEEMFKPAFSATNKPENLDTTEPNIGVFYAIKNSGIIGHSGSDGGVTAFLFFNPVKGYGMIFLANTEMEGLNGVNKNLMKGFEEIWALMGKYAGKL